MHTKIMKTLQVIRRVLELVAERGETPELKIPVGQLTEVAKRLRDLTVTQDHAARRKRALTTDLRRAGRELREDLLRPATLAAATAFPADRAKVASLRHTVRLPKSRTDYERLLVAARAMALAVEENAAQFAAAGIPKEHADRIRVAADALEAAIVARSTEEQRRMAATQGVASEARRGTALVKLISALVMPMLRNDPAKVAEWQKAIRTNRPPQPQEEGEGETLPDAPQQQAA